MSDITARPWDSNTMLSEHDYKYAAFCVNNHERLVEALGGLIDMWDAPPIDEWEKARTLLAALEAEKGGEL